METPSVTFYTFSFRVYTTSHSSVFCYIFKNINTGKKIWPNRKIIEFCTEGEQPQYCSGVQLSECISNLVQILTLSAHIQLNLFSADIKRCSLDFSFSYETKQLHNLTRLLDGRRLKALQCFHSLKWDYVPFHLRSTFEGLKLQSKLLIFSLFIFEMLLTQDYTAF